ncbi:hypothetical protein [Clostridium pasteurianum]|uniref:Lipoprotein n=1 Tax=Clostridium pasteurianum BC1 TaxID=86416 RepID=R4K809_CLOPA|nr:hypothetical protein [Clostridium pasteurianum]AGK95780.1 hypothetical protein Clopa_0748 [Clostridium pasteurianum BC1]
MLNKTTVIFLVLIVSMFLFGGCNKNISGYQNSVQNLIRKNPIKEAIEKDYEAKIQPLINDSTITKYQANKLLTYLMGNINTITKESIQKQDNELNKLVNDKVITQQQAYKIINALRK